MLNEKEILWDHFVQTYQFNTNYNLRPDIKLTRNHIFPSQTDKMRNHLAEDVLSEKFLDLMLKYQCSLTDGSHLQSTVALLQHTSVLVNIFNNDHSAVENLEDPRIAKLLEVLQFFMKWEEQF